MKPKTWKPGDPCPNCGGDVRQIPLPSDQQRADAARPMDPIPIPQSFDTATPDQIEELGRLYRCVPCWSQFRVPDAPAPAGSSSE